MELTSIIVGGGVLLRRSTAVEGAMVDCLAGKELILAATETLTIDGDAAGDNASCFWLITFQVLPA